ncbi:type II glyceraldehyde-3-phosphate dehydrogenase [Cuniculiplasma sp. SKW3]|uniref:type II glyceraldehyde-3-phosphate dehydrogenase n=1 Tax=unclassified Cuniculiplasma TaxID=2619706 RepID=UPI003FD45E9E
MIKVGINGYGTIGRRVADAVRQQKDMSVIGIVKTKPDYVAENASTIFKIYADSPENVKKFNEAGIECEGDVQSLLDNVDVIVDATPEGMGEKNMEMYKKSKVKAIFQGGEKASIAQASFNAYSNFTDSWGKDYVRVVSCNTTGLARTVSAIDKKFGVMRVEATLIRRATDPNDSKKGPINAIEPSLKFPSHHGPDLKTVMKIPEVDTVAIKVPTTLMHVHTVNVKTEKDVSQDDLNGLFKPYRRIIEVSGKSGVVSTAQIMDLAREMGRKRGDLFEIAVWKESMYASGNNIRYIQAVNQESDVVPENVDAIRAMMQAYDMEKSTEETDRAMNIQGRI